MTRYKVTLEFQMVEIVIHAKSEAEARKLARERFNKGTIKAKLLPSPERAALRAEIPFPLSRAMCRSIEFVANQAQQGQVKE